MTNPKSTAQIAGHPLHPMLIPFPVAFFVGTLVFPHCLLEQRRSVLAARVLLAVGGRTGDGALAAVAGLTDFLGDRLIRATSVSWAHMIGNVTAVVISLINFYLRSRDGDAADYPTVLWLSLVVVLILLVTGWLGWELVYKHRVGVTEEISGPG